MKKIIFLFFILYGYILYGQKNQLEDSLYRVINTVSETKQKGLAYLNLINLKLNSNPHLCKYYAEKAYKLFYSIGDKSNMGNAKLKHATSARLTNENDSSLVYIKMALQLANETKDEKLLGMVYHEMALSYQGDNDLKSALEYNLKALAIYEKSSLSDIPSSLNNIGIIYAQEGNWDKAILFFRKALQVDMKNGSAVSIGNELNNIGIFYIFKKDLDSAEYYINQGLLMRRKGNDAIGICGSYNNLALLELEKNNIPKALALADTAYDLTLSTNSKKELLEVLNTYEEIYQKSGDFKKALEYYKKLEKIRKESDTENNNRMLSEIQTGIDLEKKEKELLEKSLLLTESLSAEKRKNLLLLFSAIGFILTAFIIYYVIKSNKKLKKASAIISSQFIQVEKQKNIIEEKHRDIKDSIYYAEKIQKALLLSEKALQNQIAESFIIFKPRDVLSGDFYWFNEKNGIKILAVADCTGHGVPGALMSMIGVTFLNQLVNEKGITQPSEILEQLREGIITSLNQTNDESNNQDGMDMALVKIKGNELVFSGANNPCYIVRNNELIELIPDKQPIGFFEKKEKFTNKNFVLEKGDNVYLFSDGVIDQFGGSLGKKLKSKEFKNWLLASSSLPANDQKEKISMLFETWKSQTEQTDDVLIVGFKC